jgi:hypothetical protein
MDIMNTILPLVLAPAVSTVAKGIEAAPGIPYQAKSKAGITAVLLGASIAVRFGIAAYTGQLATLDLSGDLALLGEAITTALAAAGGYSLVRSDKPVLPQQDDVR